MRHTWINNVTFTGRYSQAFVVLIVMQGIATTMVIIFNILQLSCCTLRLPITSGLLTMTVSDVSVTYITYKTMVPGVERGNYRYDLLYIL